MFHDFSIIFQSGLDPPILSTSTTYHLRPTRLPEFESRWRLPPKQRYFNLGMTNTTAQWFGCPKKLAKVKVWKIGLLKVVSTHRTGTHPEQPLPTGYKGIPFIIGYGDCLGCALGVCCNFLGLTPWKFDMDTQHSQFKKVSNSLCKHGIFCSYFPFVQFPCIKLTTWIYQTKCNRQWQMKVYSQIPKARNVIPPPPPEV